MSRLTGLAALALLLMLAAPVSAQVDPEKRRLLQLGYDRPMSGAGPTGAYIFYYANEPHFLRENMTLRVALAPVYMDSELGFAHVAPRTDAGLGLAGGGFADGYSEVRQGHYYREDSFNGHGGSVSGTLYPRLNPESQMIPVNMVLRVSVNASVYSPTKNTAQGFVLPQDHFETRFRAGIRVGGEPPELMAPRAGELSLWYQGYQRDRHGAYGYHGDRFLEQHSHLFWTRFKVSYKLESGRQFRVAAEAGGSSTPDRINAYRIGGLLPFASEFPLTLPGYYNGELTARRYGIFGFDYLVPLDDVKRWSAHGFGDAANVAYLRGLEQPDPWNEGAGVGVDYLSRGGILRTELNYAYGFNAMRAGGRGAHSVSFLAQLDLMAWRKHAAPEHPASKAPPAKPEGLDWLFQLVRP